MQEFRGLRVNQIADMVNGGAAGTRSGENPLFFRQRLTPIFGVPAQAGYGDKRTL